MNPDNVEKVIDAFDKEEFFEGNALHGRTGFKPGTHTIADVRAWLRQKLLVLVEGVKEEEHDELSGVMNLAVENARADTKREISEWAKSTTGATGVDLRGRRWVDLSDLLAHLEEKV